MEAHAQGTTLCFGSASAIAAGQWGLPVYEIFKAGFDPFWMRGLDLFSRFHMPITIIPHFNNTEGKDFDTTCCYMGKNRFDDLRALLPPDTLFLGIDELTAALFNPTDKTMEIDGVGAVHIIRGTKKETLPSGTIVTFSDMLSV
jgi:hypothetical protein